MEEIIRLIESNESDTFNEYRKKSNFSKTEFKSLSLSHRFINNFQLINIHFRDCEITDCYFKKNIFSSSSFINTRFERCYIISCDFGTPDLINVSAFANPELLISGAKFEKVEFIKTNFLNSNFREFDFTTTTFQECKIEKCSFIHTDISKIIASGNDLLNNILS